MDDVSLIAGVQAKIESLESQVIKLTAQTRTLSAEKEDLGGRAAKLSDLLQSRDRSLVGMTSQLGQVRKGSGPQGLPPDTPQLTLTYCSPPLILTNSQVDIPVFMSQSHLPKLDLPSARDLAPRDDTDQMSCALTCSLLRRP